MNIYYENKEFNISLYHGDVNDVLLHLHQMNTTIDSVITSPPYAEQRSKFYNSVSEEDYPNWTSEWMSNVLPIQDEKGSVLINIREHIRQGEISDYVLRTRLELRKHWKECEELIWIKPDGPPVGNIQRPRRSYERILWFSQTSKPNSYPKANGKYSSDISFKRDSVGQGLKQWAGGYSDDRTDDPIEGYTRCRDYVEIPVSNNSKKEHTHPAAYPIMLSEWMIKLVSKENNIILDPFVGSGTTALAAINLNRGFIGIDAKEEYLEMAAKRIEKTINTSYKRLFKEEQ